MTRKAWDHDGRSRHQRGYGRQHEKMREHLMATVILCEECRRNRRTTVGTIADHIMPLAKGGTADRSNYQLLCADCDKDKQATDQGKVRRKRRAFGTDGWPLEEKRP